MKRGEDYAWCVGYLGSAAESAIMLIKNGRKDEAVKCLKDGLNAVDQKLNEEAKDGCLEVS